MAHLMKGRTADETWRAVAEALTAERYVSEQASRAGATLELLRVVLEIEDPVQRWVYSRQPPISPAFAIAEVIWILAGRNDSHLLNFFNRRLPQFAGGGETYHGAYGHRLRRHFGFDQLERAYSALQSAPDSRQVVLQVWDATADLPGDDGIAAAPDIPCNIVAMLKLRDHCLHWTQIVRSNDVFLGVPYNFVQFTTLQEVLAGWLGTNVGSYCHISDSMHAYVRDVPQLRESLQARSRTDVQNTDTLAFPRDESERAFSSLSELADRIVKPGVRDDELLKLASNASLPRGHRNLLVILCSEIARRRGSYRFAREILAYCTNPALVAVADAWLSRIGRQGRSDVGAAQVAG